MNGDALAVHRLGDGRLGTILAAVETGPPEVAHQAIAQAAAVPVHGGTVAGLFSGAPALAYLLHHANRAEYASALTDLDASIDAATRARLHDARDRIKAGALTRMREYDLINGLTGVGLYQMVRHRGGGLLPDVLAYLVALTQEQHAGDTLVPGWWCDEGPAGTDSPDFPGGHANFGMAHGIAGPLALLSATMSRGIEVAGQSDAVEKICAFMDAHQRSDESATWWPETIGVQEHTRPTARRRRGPGRPSWCYGVPGIARAQQLAGLALGDPGRARRAAGALVATLTDDRQLDQITDAGLCHGWAGLLVTARRIATDYPETEAWGPVLRTLSRRAEDHLARYGPPNDDSLLLGRAGIRLAERTDNATHEDWDACLLLTYPTPNPTPETLTT